MIAMEGTKRLEQIITDIKLAIDQIDSASKMQGI